MHSTDLNEMIDKLRDRGFEIHDKPGEGRVKLVGLGKAGETVTITFDVQDEVRKAC